jgi:hypothetical protein
MQVFDRRKTKKRKSKKSESIPLFLPPKLHRYGCPIHQYGYGDTTVFKNKDTAIRQVYINFNK